MKKAGIFSIIGLCVIAWLVVAQPFSGDGDSDEPQESFTSVLYAMGERQSEASNAVVDVATSTVEGSVVGEHRMDGSNWSIPNIIRHWMGVD